MSGAVGQPQQLQSQQHVPLYAAIGIGRWDLARAMLMACPQHDEQLMRDLHWRARQDALLIARYGMPFVRPSEARAEALRALIIAEARDGGGEDVMAAGEAIVAAAGDGAGGPAPARSFPSSRRSSKEKLGIGAQTALLLQVRVLRLFTAWSAHVCSLSPHACPVNARAAAASARRRRRSRPCGARRCPAARATRSSWTPSPSSTAAAAAAGGGA